MALSQYFACHGLHRASAVDGSFGVDAWKYGDAEEGGRAMGLNVEEVIFLLLAQNRSISSLSISICWQKILFWLIVHLLTPRQRRFLLTLQTQGSTTEYWLEGSVGAKGNF